MVEAAAELVVKAAVHDRQLEAENKKNGGGGGGGGGAKAKAMNKNPFLSWSDKELLVASTCFVELELPTFTHPVIHEERRYHVSSPRIFHTCMHRS